MRYNASVPFIWPYPFPNENAKDPVEVWRTARRMWERAQKFRGGQFQWSGAIPAATVRTITLTDVSAGGTDVGIDNTIAGMFVTVSPPSGIDPLLQVDYAYVSAPGTLTFQVRNDTAAPLAAAGTWSYIGYTF